AAAPSPSSERIEQTPAAPAASAAAEEAPAVAASPAANGSANGGRQVASPLVRKLARENHLDLSHVTGSGPGGRIIRADISNLLGGGAPAGAGTRAAPPPAPGPPRRPDGRAAGPRRTGACRAGRRGLCPGADGRRA